MKKMIPRGAGNFLLLLLCLAAVQFLSAFFTVIATVVLSLTGIMPLVGPTPLWGLAAGTGLVCLAWLGAGRLAAQVVRPGAAEAVTALVLWAVLSRLLGAIPLLFFPQEVCGGMLREVLYPLCRDFQGAESLGRTAACFLLAAMFGSGLLWGRGGEGETPGEGALPPE